MKMSEAFPSKFLKAVDIEDDTVVTIKSVEMESVSNDGEEKPILYFDEMDKGLVLNKTNAEAITKALGSDDTDDWEGGRITLFVTTVTFQGKPTEAIRVKMRKPKGQAQAQPQTTKRQALTQNTERPYAPDAEDDEPIPF